MLYFSLIFYLIGLFLIYIFQMRVWVLKRRKLKNSLRFSFLLLVTRWFADRLNLVLCYKNWFDITGFDVTFVDNLIKQDEMYIPALKKKVPVFYYYD